MQHSPHFDWVVAYIGFVLKQFSTGALLLQLILFYFLFTYFFVYFCFRSYFHKSIISHLLSCAIKEFYSDEPCDDEFSDLFRTAIRILDYFTQKYPEEVKNAMLTLFQVRHGIVCGMMYGMVWCGVVWCGVVWCGVVWCGVVWCGVVWCGVVWYGMVWYVMVLCGV